ncbi:MAG: hypothetical protein GY765_08945 [bacterium]|nr:hypothetical protein [bacterium]
MLVNALEAMEETEGSVDVVAENCRLEPLQSAFLPPGDYLKIHIRDGGPGIRAEDRPKIFDPYFSTKNRVSQSGLGLGLAIVYSIVKHHQGHIDVDSRVGEGTKITVYLPSTP